MPIKQAEYVGSYVDLRALPGGLPEVALVGRSNVGKSSLINRLANRRRLALTSSSPGKTRTINYYRMDGAWHLVDLPGYGFARVSREERRRWGAMVEGYLKGSTRLRGVVLLLDIRHDPGELDRQMWQWLDHYGIRRLVVATKADKVSRGQRPRHLARIRRALGTQAMPICFSAITGEGSEELEAAIAGLLQAPLSQG